MAAVSAPISAVQVGLGGRGTDWALRVLPAAPGLRVVGWAESDPDHAAAFVAATGAPRVHSGLKVALDAVDAEAVLITTDPASHGEVIRAALVADKHVLVEKPFTVDLTEAEDLVRLARERGRVLAVAQDYRFFAATSQVRHLLAQEVVGRTRHVTVAFRRNQRFPAGSVDSSVLWQVSVHHFDLLRAFFGDARWITARSWPRGQSGDQALASFSAGIEFASGVTAHYSASANSPALPTQWTGTWTVECDDGVLEWAGSEPADGAYARFARVGGCATTEVPVGIPVVRDRWAVVDQFVRAVRAGADSEISGRANLGTIAMASAAETSMASGQCVTLPGGHP